MRQPSEHASTRWHAIGAATIIGLSLAFALSVSRALPYYFLWDMDLTASIDTLVLNGGRIPVHINHPGFGLNLVQALTQRVAHATGHLSLLELTDLARSLDPLAAMAEYTEFVRRHSPFIAVAIVVVLWGALRELLRPGPWADLGMLALLATQDGLFYQAGLVRTETYAILFWSIAVFLIVRACRGPLNGRRTVAFVFAGVFLGLAFLTKLQVIFYLVAAPLLALRAAASSEGLVEPFAARTKREAYGSAASGLLALILFGALLLYAHFVPGPFYLEHQIFTQEIRFSAFGLATLALYVAVPFLLVLLLVREKWTSPSFAFLRMSALLLLGFVLAFALHLAPYGWSSTGLRYMAYDAKMLFFRSGFRAGAAGIGRLEELWWQVRWDPALVALLVLFLLASVREAWRTRDDRPRAAVGLVHLGLTSLALLNAAVASRFVLRDLVWTQVLALVVVLIATFDFFRRWTPGRVVAIGLLAVVMVGQLAHGRDVIQRLEANYNLYGFDEDRWFKGVYVGDHFRYGAIMKSAYGAEDSPLREVARRTARRFDESRRAVDYVLREPGIDQRRIGVLSEGSPIWVDDLSSRVTALPEDLREAIVIDPTSATGGGIRFDPPLVRRHSEAREKLRGYGAPGSLSLMPRPDLRVFLFYAAESPPDRIASCSRDAGLGPIEAGGVKLAGREITTYCELDAAELPGRYAVVIKQAKPEKPAKSGGGGRRRSRAGGA